MFKRIIDIVISLVILFLTLPLVLLLVFLIKVDSKDQAIIKQRRAGQYGREFTLYKFRTMKINTPIYEIKPKDDDSRITKIGNLLRYTGLDELPQVLNVLKGEMSLVGPRPEMPFIAKNYTQKQRQRLKVKPGITGPWQISGRTKQPIIENLEYDLNYTENQSIVLDFKILYRTLRLFIDNIYHLFK